ncbi:Transcriptional activator ARO80 [Spathaspora sp. JA1]|nr:Transcriptional activator ARO80 [Spathaspora sp. JA1]
MLSGVYDSGQQQQHQSPRNAEEAGYKFKRNYRACLNCRVRKVKCDLGPVDNPRDGKCARCLRERKDCVFVESKRGGSGNVIDGKRKKRVKEVKSGSTSPGLPTGYPYESPAIPRLNDGRPNAQESRQKLPGVSSILGQDGALATPATTTLPLQSQITTPSGSLLPFSTPPVHISANQSSSSIQQDSPQQNKTPNHFSTMEGALVFLANAAGTIAKADERDNIDGRTRYEQIEAKMRSETNSVLSSNSDVPPEQDTNGGISSNTSSRVPSPAVNQATTNNGANTNETPADDINQQNNQPSHNHGHHQHHHHHQKPPQKSSIPAFIMPSTTKRMTMPPAENGYVVRPKASNKLSNIEYIGPPPNGILTEQEAERLINLFFTTMHPFFPHLPKFLHSPKVLSGYPILLCAILTISSRYHPFENNTSTSGNTSVPRNIEVHDRLWLYVQRLISQTVWAEASTRSIGTIFAFLLFTEWNPRAIHWRWSDYANKADENNDEGSSSLGINNLSGFNGGGVDNEPNLAGLGAMRRSYRMAWMLIGSAVRLAQDMGFMEVSSKTFIATHIAEINSVMNIARRSMLAHSLSEVDLDEDEITEEYMEEVEEEDDDDKMLKMSEEDLRRVSTEHILKFTKSQKAQIELLQIISLGHESLYGYKAQLGSLSQRQNLSVLNIISPLINNWDRKYKAFLTPSNNKLFKHISNITTHWLKPNSKVCNEIAEYIERESFIFEFNYVKLYIYSLALSPSPRALLEQKKNRKHGKVTLKLDEMSKSAKYIEQAFNAANEMLYAAHRVHRLKMLRFMPVRWLTRMVRAVAFIVKCYLTITAHKNSSKSGSSNSIDNYDSTILSLSLITIDDITSSIQRAAITLRDCSPDELHLCTRYSNVLMYLCSEMKTRKNHQEEEVAAAEEEQRVKLQEQQHLAKRQKLAFDALSSEDGATSMFQQQPALPRIYEGNGDQTMSTNQQMGYPMQSQPAQSSLDSFEYTQGGSYFRNNNNGSISQSESMTPNDSNTPLQTLVGDSEVIDWFMNNRTIGLDFVGPWTEMIEQQLNLNDQFNFNDAL